MGLSTKEAIKKYFDHLENLYQEKNGDLPYIPYDSEIQDTIYVGEPTKESWIRWKAVEKNTENSLAELELQLNIKFHKSITEYFNSYWFAVLSGNIGDDIYELFPVIPGNEIDEFANTLIEYLEYCSQENRPFQYIPIGFEVNSSNPILVDNKTGEIFLEDVETQKYIWISKSLADFIEELI